MASASVVAPEARIESMAVDEAPLPDPERIDRSLSDIDARISKQLDVILHHPAFQKLEAAWRGLAFAVSQTDFREDIQIEIWDVAKDELVTDVTQPGEPARSALHALAHTAATVIHNDATGRHRPCPYAAFFCSYELGPGAEDMRLLRACAAVAAAFQAPFFAGASPMFFGWEDFSGLASLDDPGAILQGAGYAHWQEFRASDDARYAGLLLPRFLLRLPYGRATGPARSFEYEEDVATDHERYLWGCASYALATRLADSFAKYRWCPNIVGRDTAGGALHDLPVHRYASAGAPHTKGPTEVAFGERREYTLSESGFIPFWSQRDSSGACFLSASSCQRHEVSFGPASPTADPELGARLMGQFPWQFMIHRFAQTMKAYQQSWMRERATKSPHAIALDERAELEEALNTWIRQYTMMDVAEFRRPALICGPRYLWSARVDLHEMPGDTGRYRMTLQICPRGTYMGSRYTLSVRGVLDR
jgi:type VI secretion system protein ImpC